MDFFIFLIFAALFVAFVLTQTLIIVLLLRDKVELEKEIERLKPPF